MGQLTGKIKGLKASEKRSLEQLSSQRSSSDDIISVELAKRASSITAALGVKIALLLERGGQVAFTVVGDRNTVYLPDLGRYRLNEARLRRLRLVVFLPDGQHDLESREKTTEGSPYSESELPANFKSPAISFDLVTDLEKLRFDALLCIAVDASGVPRQLSLAYLQALQVAPGSARFGSSAEIATKFLHHLDFYGFTLNFGEFIAELEAGFSESRQRGYDTAEDHALIVGVYDKAAGIEASLEEIYELSRAAGIQVLDSVVQKRRKLDPKTVVGKGKLEEITLHSLDQGADLLLFDRELSPGQLRAITGLTEMRVIDRSMLILDIFARNAKSREGKLQVELAQLKYLLPRLADRDAGLSRLTGGIGTRGPGETKLEISRRRTRDRIKWLEKQLENVAKQRSLRRERRQERGVPVLAIVGYTNAGKSTLLNALTASSVIVEDKMFATLETASRRLRFPDEKEVVLVDTVGFIRELPDELVAAFRSTLEEVGEADLLIHLVDASERGVERRIAVVEQTLEELGFADTPRILVLNKCDRLGALEVKAIQHKYESVAVSALDRETQKELVAQLKVHLRDSFEGMDPDRFTEVTSTP